MTTFLLDKSKKIGIVSRWLTFTIALIMVCALAFSMLQIKPNSLSLVKGLLFSPYISNDDSWMPMIKALDHLHKTPQQSPYEIFFKDNVKFQYPLTSLLVFDFPQKITGASYIQIAYWLDRICFMCIFILSFVSTKILLLILKEKKFEGLAVSSTGEVILLYMLVLILTLFFNPIIRSYNLGQIQTILTLLSAISILCWQCNRKIWAGIVIGLICLIKPQLALLFIWGIIRKQWGMVISGGLVIGLGLLISIGLYGFHNNLDYLNVLSFLSKHGESFQSNQSINGIMHRLLFIKDSFDWHGFPPYSPIVYITTLISSLIIMLTGLFWNYKKENSGILDLSIMTLCATIASPIAWEHHYSILLTIFIIMSPFMCYFYKEKKWSLLLFAFAYLLVSQYFKFIDSFANTKWNMLVSYLFFGTCIMLFFLFNITKKLNNEK